MQIDQVLFDLIRPILFLIGISPLLWNNLSDGTVQNDNLAILLIVGLMQGITGALLLEGGYDHFSIALLLVGTVLCIGGAAANLIPGGVGKFLVALLPWFGTVELLVVLSAGFFFTGLWGMATQRNTPIVPGPAFVGLGIMIISIF